MDTIRPKIRVRSAVAPYLYHRLGLVNPGHDRCLVLHHLLFVGLTIERGGHPARYDETPGLFQIIGTASNSKVIEVRPIFKRTINPLIYDTITSMSNRSGELTRLAEIGARFESYIDNPVQAVQGSPSIKQQLHETTQLDDTFDEMIGLSLNDLDIG